MVIRKILNDVHILKTTKSVGTDSVITIPTALVIALDMHYVNHVCTLVRVCALTSNSLLVCYGWLVSTRGPPRRSATLRHLNGLGRRTNAPVMVYQYLYKSGVMNDNRNG